MKYPNRVKTLILLATTAHIEPNKIDQTFEFYDKFENMNFEEKLQVIIPLIYTNAFTRKLKKEKELYKYLKKDMNPIVHSNHIPQLKDYINQYKALVNFDTPDSLHRIKQPTLIAVGSKALHEKIPNSRLEIFENLKHGFIIEEPGKIKKVIWDFIKDHLG